MEHIWTILIEFAFLGLVAFCYYLYQKNKILRNDKIDIFQTLDEMITDIKKFIEKDEKLENKNELNTFVTKLEEVNESQNYVELVLLLKSPPSNLSEEFTDSFPSIIEQVQFHIKKK